MTKKSLSSRLISTVCVAASVLMMTTSVLAAEISATPASPQEVAIVTSQDITVTRAYEYEWRYKNIDGRAHKRLYNLTLGRWEGDWIAL